MSVGSRRLAACCANGGLSNNQIPTCPFTTISLNFEEENRFITGDLTYKQSIVTHNYPYAEIYELVTWNAVGFSGPANAWKYTVVSTSVGAASWTVASSSIVSVGSNGPIVRPGTNTVIAFGPYKYRSYTFNKTSASRAYTSSLQQGGQITKIANLCACVACDSPQTFDEQIEGPLITSATVPLAPTTATLTWVGVCSNVVTGITLVLTASGISTGPWVVEVTAGTLRLTNGSGVTTTYSGLLTTVRNSINAAGMFTATLIAATSDAETQDLKPTKTNPIGIACTIEVPIAFPGDLIAPGSRTAGNQTGVFTLGAGDAFNASTSGFPNNATGFSSYLGQGWYAKLSLPYSGIGALKSAPTSAYFSLSGNWSRTSGTSEITRDYTLTGSTGTKTDVTIVCFECVSNDPFPSCGFGQMSPGFLNLDVGAGSYFNPGPGPCSGWTDCSFGVAENCPCPPSGTVTPFSRWDTTQTPIVVPDIPAIGRQKITGRIVVG